MALIAANRGNVSARGKTLGHARNADRGEYRERGPGCDEYVSDTPWPIIPVAVVGDKSAIGLSGTSRVITAPAPVRVEEINTNRGTGVNGGWVGTRNVPF